MGRIPDSGTMPLDVSAWMDELASIGRRNDRGMTVPELSKAMGVSEKIVYRRLQEAAAAGRLVVGKRTSNNLIGRKINTPVYSIAPAETRRRKKGR